MKKTLYFDPSIGRLRVRQEDKLILPNITVGGFFGGVYSSGLTEARGRGYSSKSLKTK